MGKSLAPGFGGRYGRVSRLCPGSHRISAQTTEKILSEGVAAAGPVPVSLQFGEQRLHALQGFGAGGGFVAGGIEVMGFEGHGAAVAVFDERAELPGVVDFAAADGAPDGFAAG